MPRHLGNFNSDVYDNFNAHQHSHNKNDDDVGNPYLACFGCVTLDPSPRNSTIAVPLRHSDLHNFLYYIQNLHYAHQL